MWCRIIPTITIIFGMLTAVCGCSNPSLDFNRDPFDPSHIESACRNQDADFLHYVEKLSETDKIQAVAVAEKVPGCMDKYDWLKKLSDNAYRDYGAAFYDSRQPWNESRGLHAFEDAVNSVTNRKPACSYLWTHREEWQKTSWAGDQLDKLESQAAYSDEIYSLLVRVADETRLNRLIPLANTPDRESILSLRWKDLPQEDQNRLLGRWISASWTMQTSGSSQLPQYLTLDWVKKPLPEGMPDFVSTLEINTLRINNREVRRRNRILRETAQLPALREPNLRHHRFDLQPWLNTADNYRISGKCTISVWDPEVSEDCIQQQESCDQKPLTQIPVEFDKKYRVFVGFETGAPKRHREDAENQATSKAMHLEICDQDECIALWDGKKTESRSQMDITQGHDFYLNVALKDAELPVAARLMARQGEGKSWREVATFFSYEPQNYDVPIRAAIDLGDLCQQTGPCKLSLQLRPSLRFARRDPRITRYWGDTLELGTVSLNLQNRTARQIWSDF